MKKILLSLILLFILTGHSWAVVSSTISQNEYACNSSNTAWNYTFPIILSTDIQVWTIDQYGNPTQQTSNFSVNTYTQTVTYPVTGTPCATGNNLLLLRVQPFTQLVAASNQGPAPSPVVMGMSDKLTMLAQQIEAQMNRAVLAPLGSTSGAGYALPSPLANAYLGWDSTGTFIQNYVTQGLTTASTPTFAGLTITGYGGMLKASGPGTVGIATSGSDYTSPTGTESLTNKTFDTASNTFKLNGTTFSGGITGNGTNIITGTSIKGSSGVIASASGSPTANNCAKWDASGNLVDNGSTCSGGTGMVYPASSGIAVSDTTKWLASISGTSSQFVMGDASLKSLIENANINWTDIQGIIKSQNINWTDINGIAELNEGGINFPSISGVISHVGLNWTDFPASGLMKFNGSSAPVAATSSTDYAPVTSGTAILYGNGTGGFSNVTVGTGLSFSGGTLNASIPSGIIVMWSGSIASIPSGWVLCDGTNSTPDLRNRFIVGAYEDVTGVANTTVTGSDTISGSGELPSTSISVTINSYLTQGGDGGSGHPYISTGTGQSGGSSITASGSIGSGSVNVAVYYALAYIMKS